MSWTRPVPSERVATVKVNFAGVPFTFDGDDTAFALPSGKGGEAIRALEAVVIRDGALRSGTARRAFPRP